MQAPTGYANVDGMCSIDVRLQITLQSHHGVLGHQLSQQRNDLGLCRDEDYALIFHVPPQRFDGWNSFQKISWKEEAVVGKVAAGNAKRRRLSTATAYVSESDKRRLRKTLRQFVLTLDIEADNVLAVKVSESASMIRYVVKIIVAGSS